MATLGTTQYNVPCNISERLIIVVQFKIWEVGVLLVYTKNVAFMQNY